MQLNKIERFIKFCAAFVVGLTMAAFFGFKMPFVAMIIVLVVLILGLFLRKKDKFKNVWIFSLFAFFGAFWFFLNFNFSYKFSTNFEGENKRLIGYVQDVEYIENKYCCYYVKTKEIEGEKCLIPFTVKIYSNDDLDLKYFDEIEMTLNLKSCVKNEWFCFFDVFAASKIFLKGTKISNVKVSSKNDFFSNFLYARDFLIDVARENVKSPYSDFLVGMVFGRIKNMPYYLKRVVSRCGISHMFAVSGLHVSVLSIIIILILKLLKCPRKIAFVILFLLLFLYVAIIGFSASALRACFMSFAVTIAIFLKKKVKPLEPICFAAFCILLISPFSIFSVSFLLSFSASIGIIFLKDVFSNFVLIKFSVSNKFLVFLVESFSTTIAATLPSFIFVSFVFGKISLVAPLVNFLVVPFVGVFYISSLLLIFFGVFCKPVASFFSYIIEGLFGSLISFLEFVSKTYFCYLPTDYIIAKLIIFGLLVYFLVCFFVFKKFIFSKSFAITSCFMIFLPSLVYFFVSKDLIKIYVLGSGFGSSVVFRGQGRTVVVNCKTSRSDVVSLIEFLDGKGINKIDLLVFSFKNGRNFVGDFNLFKTIPISCVILPEKAENSSYFDWIDKEKTKVVLKNSVHLEFFPISVDILNKNKCFGMTLSLNGLVFSYVNNIKILKFLTEQKRINLAFLDFKVDDLGKLNGLKLNRGFLLAKIGVGSERFKVLEQNKRHEFFVDKHFLSEGEI